MSRNQTSNTTDTTSKYARKVQGKRMMYGNGKTCCGHHHVPGILSRMAEAGNEVTAKEETDDGNS